jgi:hypothetical protein
MITMMPDAVLTWYSRASRLPWAAEAVAPPTAAPAAVLLNLVPEDLPFPVPRFRNLSAWTDRSSGQAHAGLQAVWLLQRKMQPPLKLIIS